MNQDGNGAGGGRRREAKEVASSRYPKILWTGNIPNGFIPSTYGRGWRPSSSIPPNLNAAEAREYIAAYTTKYHHRPYLRDRRQRSLQETRIKRHQAGIHIQKEDEGTFGVKAKSEDVGYLLLSMVGGNSFPMRS